MEHFSSQYKKVVGGSKEQRDEASSLLEKLANESSSNVVDRIKPYEQMLSLEDKHILSLVEKEVDTIVAQWGGAPEKISPEKIHIVALGAVEKITDGKVLTGYHSPVEQYIVVERCPSNTEFSLVLGHEMFHQKNYMSAQIDVDGDLSPYRSGINMHDLKNPYIVYFKGLEEALTAIATRKLYNQFRESPIYRLEIQEVDSIKVWAQKFLDSRNIEIQTQQFLLEEIYTIPDSKKIMKVVSSPDYTDEYKIGYVGGALEAMVKNKTLGLSERYSERKKFDTLLGDIMERLPEEYSKDQLIDVFAKAHFTGKLFPVARILEKAFGEGGFRSVAESFKIDLREE